MSLEVKITGAMKEAMKAKDQVQLASLRAIKSELLLAKTSSAASELSADDEIKLLQKLVKQRKESARIYQEQGRDDLMQPELEQAGVIEQFLPEQASEEEIERVVDNVIETMGASGMQDMGKVMGMASKQLSGKADGGTISKIVKQKLSN